VVRASDCQCQVATVLGPIPASFDTVESEGRHYIERIDKKIPLVHRTEPSRLQSLALQLSDKIGQLVENNERLLEQRGQVNHPVSSTILIVLAVLLMRKIKYKLKPENQCCGSGMFIPDP
jgi:hypothetical protein